MTEPPTFPPEWFRREDEDDDTLFYDQPRLVVHIDDPTIEAIRSYLGEALPTTSEVLDLMSAWRSHLPDGFAGHVVGLGMNETELRENPQLDEWVVHDLNANPAMPFDDARFDAAYVAVSVQYMTRPIEIFAGVRRVLKPDATFHVIFSDRMFPTKAVAIWRALGPPEKRAELIGAYFGASGGWSQPEFLDRSPSRSFDPAYIVRASKLT